MQDHNPLTHRGIAIVLPEVPGAPFSWSHDESGLSGASQTREGAIRQISRRFGPEPNCNNCAGTGQYDQKWQALDECPLCFPEDPV